MQWSIHLNCEVDISACKINEDFSMIFFELFILDKIIAVFGISRRSKNIKNQ